MIWHLSTRERERKKRLDHSEKKNKKKTKKNNGTGLANKLKFNDRLDIFFGQKQPAILRKVLFTSIDD